MRRIPLYALVRLMEDRNEKLSQYSREVQKALSSQNAKGRVQICLMYPGLVEHGA